MTTNKVLYLLLVLFVAVLAAFGGVLAGGVVAYRYFQNQDRQAALVASPIDQADAAVQTEPPLLVSNTDIQTNITQAVIKVRPAIQAISG